MSSNAIPLQFAQSVKSPFICVGKIKEFLGHNHRFLSFIFQIKNFRQSVFSSIIVSC